MKIDITVVGTEKRTRKTTGSEDGKTGDEEYLVEIKEAELIVEPEEMDRMLAGQFDLVRAADRMRGLCAANHGVVPIRLVVPKIHGKMLFGMEIVERVYKE